MPRCSRANNYVWRAHCISRRRRHCGSEEKYCAWRKILSPLTGEAFVARYDELTKLTADLKISLSLQSKKNNICDETVSSKIEKQDALEHLLDTVQDNTMNPTQFASTSQISLNDGLDKKHDTVQISKKSMKGKRKNNKEHVNGKNRTKHLVTNQVEEKHLKVTKKNKAEVENKANINKENCNMEMIKNNAKKIKKVKKIFSDYIPIPKIMNILKKQSLKNVQYIKGNLRINPFYYKYSYLTLTNEERDLLIIGIPNRNRAFEGDLVVAHINPENLWHKYPDGTIQKTGKIVCILEKVHSRRAVGYIKKQNSLLIFYPKDQRVPLVDILPESIPSLYHKQPELYKNTIFFVNIDFWDQIYASGQVLTVVGKSGEIDTELNAIILENNLDMSPYQETLLKGLPSSDYSLTETDIKDREDWRHECVFTIDPATAVDIDDALSCKVLDNGNYEIGVHISDVTHYLEFFSPLDKEILKRATSIYLPHMTFHMLPERLCKICSLLPGEDRLAFSVIWEITPNAEIVKHRFAKTVIRSCCQMSYESAQALIDDPKKSWPNDFLDIKGDYTASLISDTVNKLHKLSIQLQNKRFINGALRLEQPKLQIHIDSVVNQEGGVSIPIKCSVYERKDSNSLIEEFMLLANMTVAVHLYITIPKTALLRIHKAPAKQCLKTLHNILQKYGIHLDIETAGALQASINRYSTENNSVNSMKSIMMVIINLCSKSMTRAEYICASTILPYDLKHYALNVPLYTHFTSPIRRYSDCIVHRLLSATLKIKPLPKNWTDKLCSKIAANCNVKKYNAKVAQEQSTEIFLAYLVGLSGEFEAAAIVMYVKEDSIEIILRDSGIKLRVNLKDMESFATLEYSTDCVPTITIKWIKPAIVQVINLFSLVHVQVKKINEELRLKATLLPPSQ